MSKFSELQKQELAVALESYFKQKQSEDEGFSQNDLAKLLGRASSYVTYIFQRQFDKATTAGTPVLTDRIWEDVKALVGYDRDVWPISNYDEIMSKLLDAKIHHYQYILDGSTGMGKTFTSGLFKKKYPKNTFYVKCYADMTIKDFVKSIAKEVGVSNGKSNGTIFSIREAICEKLYTLPSFILIVDETEKASQNNTLKVIDILQSMHDYNDLFRRGSFVVMGANNFHDRLKDICKRKNPHSVPQFLSRFDVVPLKEYSIKEAKNVCVKHYKITDKDTVDTLVMTSKDYRQLSRRIERHLNTQKLMAS